MSIINSKGRFYYNAKFLNAQILSHQLTIINNTPKKKPLINRQYLFHAMLKKNNKKTIHPTPTIQSAYQPKLLFPAKVVGADVEKAPSDFLLAITYHLAI